MRSSSALRSVLAAAMAGIGAMAMAQQPSAPPAGYNHGFGRSRWKGNAQPAGSKLAKLASKRLVGISRIR